MQYPTHFIFNSDYPFDMIVYYKYVEYTKGTTPESFNHNLGFAPLLFGMWSETEDFAVARPYSDQSATAYHRVAVESDDTKVYITTNSQMPTGHKCYLKIYGFAPISWTGDCAPTSQSNSELLLNTDNAYSPLLAAGAVQPRRMDNPDTQGEQTGIAENIGKDGYIEVTGRASDISLYYQEPLQPMVMLWKTTASTGRTAQRYGGYAATSGYPIRTAPYATYNNAGAQGSGQMAIAISAGVTRTGMANYNDIMHFRVYG